MLENWFPRFPGYFLIWGEDLMRLSLSGAQVEAIESRMRSITASFSTQSCLSLKFRLALSRWDWTGNCLNPWMFS